MVGNTYVDRKFSALTLLQPHLWNFTSPYSQSHGNPPRLHYMSHYFNSWNLISGVIADCFRNLTGADILLSFPLIAGRGRAGLTKVKYPKLYDYIDRLREEQGYKKAAEKIIALEGSFDETIWCRSVLCRPVEQFLIPNSLR